MTIEYITLAVYTICLLVVGALFSRFNRNVSDFVRGGAQGTWWMVGTSMLMGGISAFTFTGNASAAFDAGPTFLVIYLGNIIALVASAIFLAAWLRQTRAFTNADIISQRFGTAAEQFSVYSGILLQPFGAAIQLWALSVFASAVFGFPLTGTIVVIGLIVVFYSTTGGRWAVMATDFIQSLVLISITILVAVLALIKVGGIDGFFQHFSDPGIREDFAFVKEAGQFGGDRFTLKWIIVIFFMQVYSQLGLGMGARYLAAKDGREASRAAALAAVLMTFGTFVWFVPPMVARFLYGDEILAQTLSNPSETSYAFIAMKLLPNGLMGIMIAAMFSATMSSMDTGLNNQVGTVVRNLIPRVRAWLGRTEPLSDELNLKICRLLTLAFGGVIIFYSILLAERKELILFDAYLLIGSIIGVPLGFPLFVGLYFKKLPRWSYFAIVGACLVPSAYSVVDGWVSGTQWTIQDRTLWIFIFGIAATLVCTALHRTNSEKATILIREFYKRMHTPVDFLSEVGLSRDYEQLKILGKTVLYMGCALSLILLVPNEPWGRLCVLFLVAFTVSIGLLMRHGARLEQRRQEQLKENLDGPGNAPGTCGESSEEGNPRT